jgi:hypothetical protein
MTGDGSDLHQSTSSLDISAGTAKVGTGKGARVVRTADKQGDESTDEERIRRRKLEEKEALTRGMAPRTFTEGTRQKLADKGAAMPDGSYPIPDKDSLRRAILSLGRAKNPGAVKAHIIKRAKALGATGMLPDDWKVSQEQFDWESGYLAPILALEGIVPKVIVQEAPSEENGGKMRARVPFYVAESVSRAPGFEQRVYFPRDLLPSVVTEGNGQITQDKQPLTVYARHAHATSGNDLPVGKVVELEQEGRIGYATLEIAPTEGGAGGKNIQTLIQVGHLNAVSLRSGAGRFELEEKKVNGELMLQATRLAIDGIDFAPDSPAMPTYGIEVLAAEARVDDPPIHTRRKTNQMSDDLTLETIRSEYPDLVQAIEAPYKKQIKDLTAERDEVRADRDSLFAEKQKQERERYLDDIASNFPDPSAARVVLAEMCKGAQSADEIAKVAMPVLLQGLKQAKAAAEPTKTDAQKLMELFPSSGAGQSLKQESADDKTDQFEGLPRVGGGAGLPVPMS